MSHDLVEKAFHTIGGFHPDPHDFPPSLYRIDPHGQVREMVRGDHYVVVYTAAQVGARKLQPIHTGDLLAISYVCYAAPSDFPGPPSQCPERKEVRALLAVDGDSKVFYVTDDPQQTRLSTGAVVGPVVDGLLSTMSVLRSVHEVG